MRLDDDERIVDIARLEESDEDDDVLDGEVTPEEGEASEESEGSESSEEME